MADDEKVKVETEQKQEVTNKPAGLGEILMGNVDEHGQATNLDGSPVKEITPK